MSLEIDLLLHIAKGLVYNCSVYFQYGRTLAELNRIALLLEDGVNQGIPTDELKQLEDQAHVVQIQVVDLGLDDSLYLAALSLGQLALCLREPHRQKTGLALVMAEISMSLGL